MTREEYWIEAVESSLEEAGIAATREQIEAVAGDIEVSHEQIGMAFGDDVASRNARERRDQELADVRKQLRDEQSKVTCAECRGSGCIVNRGPVHSAESTCWRCQGAGRHAP